MTAPNREIELKFLLEKEAVPAALAALPPGETIVNDLVAVYYDTADHWLGRHGFSLRVRRTGKVRVQTLKSAPGEAGGRDEWDWPVNADRPDPALLEETPAALPAGMTLEPQFTVRSRRTIRLVEEAGSLIELVIDDAEVRAGDRRETFLELEIELKAGAPAALFALARRLLDGVPLRLSAVSKAERGYALAGGATRRRPRYAPPRPEDELTAGQAFQLIGAACLAHLCANAESLRATPGPEGVHQLRVAVRRLRAALATFKPVALDADREGVRQSLKWLAGELDEARNLDVFIAEAWRPAARDHHDLPGMAEFGRALLTAQTAAYARAAAALDSPRFRTSVLDIAAWLQCGPWTRDAADGPRGQAAERFAAGALERRRRKVLKAGRGLSGLDAPGRHRARIQAKVLRYASEDLGALLTNHPKRAKRFVAALGDLQDSLGALNDLAFSEGLAREVTLAAGLPEAAFAAGRLTGEEAQQAAQLLKAARKAFKAFARARPFWDADKT